MEEIQRRAAFRGLPLTSQQDSEIRHYIHCRQRNGLPWDTEELGSMLHDMLSPPEATSEESGAIDGETRKERDTALSEAYLDGREIDKE
ncbi:hypothetical protein [Massilia sp. Leaf139]|uniref:hypothetical protein n=1 Tax=Massilia sp. Leaf139 TaxID=1736272 RepID=UPI0006F57615|nr:hypothetical protein [Massilia sp. Leaf139]KQQ94952.1 hypothetical protein ASF77_22115 [Massilia sp. Leaf139]